MNGTILNGDVPKPAVHSRFDPPEISKTAQWISDSARCQAGLHKFAYGAGVPAAISWDFTTMLHHTVADLIFEL